MSRFLKILKLLYRKAKHYRGILLLFPTQIKFYIKGNPQFFHIFTHLTKKERLLLYKLALSLPKESIVVEIGSYLGASSSFLAVAIKERDGKVYCIDTW